MGGPVPPVARIRRDDPMEEQHVHETEADVVVLGAGPAGEVAAGRLAEGGLDVVLVEDRLVGGECSYWGCMPSKALLRPVELLAETQRVPGVRELVHGTLDPQVVLDRRDEVIHELDDSAQLPWLQERDIRLVRGRGVLTAERTVEVSDADAERPKERIVARRAVVIAVGTSPAFPPVEGLRDAAGWTNREATTADEVPATLTVMGGGPIGAELAVAWASLGARVTLLEQGPRLLAKEEPYAGEEVAQGLRAMGIDVRTGVKVVSATRSGDRPVVVLEGGEHVEADELLVAAGRAPNTAGLGLDAVGVAPDEHGWLGTDEHLRVGGREWLYAVGDVNGRALLTHQGKRQARVASAHVLGDASSALGPHEPDGAQSPRVTFTEPQVAAVGLTLEDALAAGIDAVAVDVPSDGNAGASFVGKDAGGTTRFVVDRTADVLVGATFVGAAVAEHLHAATIAVTARVPLALIDQATPVFPTRTEIWLRLIERRPR
ncbi:dihydrolipoyl dehydrogenase family protein [Patulibacter americanus]|uniref:dihydrolipoyl dehydrogenase family protein n=1 Tax=Patulibacter americanus TaxID=588672 RepID=UPI0003B57E53|nr:NAD(P)/FAD-dependent oxidoreductase [Patulibacter americanus]